MRIVCSITVPEAQKLIEGRDVPMLKYVETTTEGVRRHGDKRVIVQDPEHRFYRFDYADDGRPPRADDEVILHPVEQDEHVTFTYRDLP